MGNEGERKPGRRRGWEVREILRVNNNQESFVCESARIVTVKGNGNLRMDP